MSEQGTNQIQQLQVPPAQDFDTANFQGSMQEVLEALDCIVNSQRKAA